MCNASTFYNNTDVQKNRESQTNPLSLHIIARQTAGLVPQLTKFQQAKNKASIFATKQCTSTFPWSRQKCLLSLLPCGPGTEGECLVCHKTPSTPSWKTTGNALPHLPFSTDLLPSNFHFCGPLKQNTSHMLMRWKLGCVRSCKH